MLLRLPVLAASNVVSGEPSPQSTSTDHGESGPGSSNEPRSKPFATPSSEAWFAGAVTVGATLATRTICTDSESVPLRPSESATFIFTFALEGPSGNLHSKLPPAAVAWY